MVSSKFPVSQNEKHKNGWSLLPKPDERRKMRFFFGGLGATFAVLLTHPLDLIKVLLQTSSDTKSTLTQQFGAVFRQNGIKGFYSGVSAAACRQMVYSTTRLGIYEILKNNVKSETFMQKTALAAVGGCLGGFTSVPFDIVNVRMQNDMKMPPEKRRNYRHVFHGLHVTAQESGLKGLMAGWEPAVTRSVLLTIGQAAVYDSTKAFLIRTLNMEDRMLPTHALAGTLAGCVSTLLTQPIDVVKTRLMNARPGEYKGMLDAFSKTAVEGPRAFYKGLTPAFLRLAPNTVMLMLLSEQLRLHFGYLPENLK